MAQVTNNNDDPARNTAIDATQIYLEHVKEVFKLFGR
jgi:hypothetical protein